MGPFLTYVATYPLDFCCAFVTVAFLFSCGAATVTVRKRESGK